MRIYLLIAVLLFFTLLFIISFDACNPTTKQNSVQNKPDTSVQAPKLHVAVAAITSPRETYTYYNELLKFISKELQCQIELKQRKTYKEVNELLAEKKIDLAFICSGAYLDAKKITDIEIIAVPVCYGKPFYQAYIIVNSNSKIDSFQQLKGKKFAFTDPLSNTGKLYADFRLKQFGTNAKDFFSSTLFTHAHDISIQMVSSKLVDGATIDGLVYEYLKKRHPERINKVKVIEKSENFGIPPIIVRTDLDEKIKIRLKEILLSMHQTPDGKKILDKLLIDKFVEGNDRDYDGIRKMKQFLNNE